MRGCEDVRSSSVRSGIGHCIARCITLAFLGSAIASASRFSRIVSSMSRRHEMIVHCIHVTMPWIITAWVSIDRRG